MHPLRARVIARLARRKAAATGPEVVSPTGPGGLLAVPGLQLLRRRKAEGEGDRSFVRSDDGKFSETPGGGDEKPKKAPKKPKKAPAKPPKADAAAQSAENRSTVGDVLNMNDDERLSKRGLESLNAFAEGGQLDEATRAHMEKNGLVKTDRDGVVSLTPEGRKVVAAANKGDADAVGRALDDGGKRAAGAQGRAAEAQTKREAALAKRAAAAAKKKPAAAGAAGAAAAAPKPAAGGGGGGGPKGPSPAQQTQLAQLLGGRLARSLPAAKAMRPKRSRAWKAAYAEARTAGHDPTAARRRASVALRREDAAKAERHYQRAVGRLSVFKAADGSDRWAAISATAYRDSDREIVSREALGNALVFAEAAGFRGPLRFWHIGTPWGEGCDIGDCDYQALAADGRFLVESGTFRGPAYAQAVKARGEGWQMSIGFSHPEDQPDPSGVFRNIAIFERSVVPPGRAANPFTTITTKESRMLTAEKLKALEALFGKDTAAGLLAQIGETDKAAQRGGVAYKEADPAFAELVYQLPNGLPAIIQDGKLVALKAMEFKAPGDAEAIAAGAAEGAAAGAAGAAEEPLLEEEEPEEMLLSPAEIDLIADRVVQKLMGAIDEVGQKMAATDEELKMRGYSRMKETQDKLAGQVAALTSALKELTGDIPAGQVARATQARTTTVKADDPTVQAGAALADAEAAQSPALPATPEDAIISWMERNGGGALPWSIPSAQPPVNPAQHAAPGARQV